MDGFNSFMNNEKQSRPSVWKLDKDQVINFMKSLPKQPLAMKPIPDNKKGSNFNEDGIRVTGSKKFVDSVLSRLKDLLVYENQKTKLSLLYRQIPPRPNQPDTLYNPSFVFYAQLHSRIANIDKVKL